MLLRDSRSLRPPSLSERNNKRNREPNTRGKHTSSAPSNDYNLRTPSLLSRSCKSHHTAANASAGHCHGQRTRRQITTSGVEFKPSGRLTALTSSRKPASPFPPSEPVSPHSPRRSYLILPSSCRILRTNRCRCRIRYICLGLKV
jgi:hypothetical protein